MNNEEVFLQKRLLELAERSYKCSQYFFTGFMSSADVSLLHEVVDNLNRAYKLWGGSESCERKMARFGDEASIGYDMPFPIATLHIEPMLEKFSDEFSHRDFLGAIMNLGVKRETLGDIFIIGKHGYIYVDDKISEYIIDSLDKVRHTHVKVTRVYDLPQEITVNRNEIKLLVSSLRLDVVIAGKCKLSRNQVLELFRTKKVFLNERICENNSYTVKIGDIISVRGYGKMIFKEISGETRKGRIYIQVEEYA